MTKFEKAIWKYFVLVSGGNYFDNYFFNLEDQPDHWLHHRLKRKMTKEKMTKLATMPSDYNILG